MAYTRWNESGNYIYGGESFVNFNGTVIDDDAVDVFIYKLYDVREDVNDEFWQRYFHGKQVIDNFSKGFRIQKLTKHYSANLDAETVSISALAGIIWREHYTPIIGAEQVEYMLEKYQSAQQIYTDIKKNNYTYFIARETKNNELIGYCGVAPKIDSLYMSKLYVSRNFRGNGVARGFLSAVISLCKVEYDISKICLTVNKGNTDAIAAYEKMGFETVDSVKKDIGGGFFMDDYVMMFEVKSLNGKPSNNYMDEELA